MNTIDYAKKQMQEKELSFLVLKNEPLLEETTYHPKVILNSLRENKHIFSGALVATRVLGRAGALLLAYGGVKEVYADIIQYSGCGMSSQQQCKGNLFRAERSSERSSGNRRRRSGAEMSGYRISLPGI